MKYFFTYRSDGVITAYSDVENKTELSILECDVSDEDVKNIEAGYILTVEKEKLCITKSQKIIDREREEEVKNTKEGLKQKLSVKNPKFEDVIPLLLKLL